MNEIYLLSIIMRTLAALLFLLVSMVLVRARRLDGPIVNAFCWAWLASTVAQWWFIAASLMYWSRCCPWMLVMWEWSWVVWTPCAIAALNLVHVLRRSLPWPARQPLPPPSGSR